ncbi:hypothetical protein [Rubellicoccus peritrichatus]|uniref:Secreted protein with PEP-CTERM sorting signal n=1 Tax=Rubellicoccus peritrichatus TaxID=3080537 RepID=A0AAQ3LB87_9BACT|nr:hypothetical protein [Puniceicoccus sp. CR14]WOO42650.1 hypothetical protein RZN69_06065 [Puniceicoccus sp. CR14]
MFGRSTLFSGKSIGFAALLLTPALSPAFDVVLDYSDDIAGRNFFGGNATATAALEAAATAVSNAITTQLGAITTDPVTGTNGSTSYTINPNYIYSNPETGVTTTLNNATSPLNEYRVYVGTQLLTGSTLGQGGPGGRGVSTSGGGFESEWIGAVSAAESAFNAQYNRGGPIFSTFNFAPTLGSTTANATINMGGTLGNLWFDVDTDNDLDFDTSTELSDFWHFDHTTPVESGKIDFYSVALHELIHAVGFGLIDSWDDLVSGTDWTGPEVIALLGTGTDVLDPDQSHIKAGTMGLSIVDDSPQEAIMDPDITAGTRKQITDVDLAFLQDMGFSVVPEPGHYAVWAGVLSLLVMLVFRRRSVR